MNRPRVKTEATVFDLTDDSPPPMKREASRSRSRSRRSRSRARAQRSRSRSRRSRSRSRRSRSPARARSRSRDRQQFTFSHSRTTKENLKALSDIYTTKLIKTTIPTVGWHDFSTRLIADLESFGKFEVPKIVLQKENGRGLVVPVFKYSHPTFPKRPPPKCKKTKIQMDFAFNLLKLVDGYYHWCALAGLWKGLHSGAHASPSAKHDAGRDELGGIWVNGILPIDYLAPFLAEGTNITLPKYFGRVKLRSHIIHDPPRFGPSDAIPAHFQPPNQDKINDFLEHHG